MIFMHVYFPFFAFLWYNVKSALLTICRGSGYGCGELKFMPEADRQSREKRFVIVHRLTKGWKICQVWIR